MSLDYANPQKRKKNKDVVLKRGCAPRDGHTARCKNDVARHVNDNRSMTLGWSVDYEQVGKHAYARGLTALDSLDMVNRVAWGSRHSAPQNNDDGTISFGVEKELCQHKEWEALAVLEQHAVKKRERRTNQGCRSGPVKDGRTVEYTLPVVSEMVERVDAVSRRAQRRKDMFVWNGQKWDRTKIYYCHGRPSSHQFLKPQTYGYVEKPQGSSRLYGTLRVKGDARHFSIKQLRPNTKRYSGSPNDHAFANDGLGPYQGSVKNVDIDYGTDRRITHFSIMGHDHVLHKYPHSKEERRRCNMPEGERINYCMDDGHQYVTKFDLQVRAHGSRKWVRLGSFTGNSDRWSEVLHTLDTAVTCRYLRITPLSFNGSPSMRVCAWGPVDAKAEAQATKDHVKTVTYSVAVPSKTKYLPSYASYSWNYCYGSNNNRRACKADLDALVKGKGKQVEHYLAGASQDDYWDEEEEEWEQVPASVSMPVSLCPEEEEEEEAQEPEPEAPLPAVAAAAAADVDVDTVPQEESAVSQESSSGCSSADDEFVVIEAEDHQ